MRMFLRKPLTNEDLIPGKDVIVYYMCIMLIT